MSKQPTILDVAKHSGYSKSTISLVLQDSPEIPISTKKAILKSIEEIGYRKNRFARGLRTNRSQVIGMVIQDHLNPFYAEIVQHAERLLRKNGFDLIVGSSDTDLTLESQVIERMFEHQVDGMIISATDYERVEPLLKTIQSQGVHCVIAGPPPWGISFDSATIECGVGVQAAMDLLLKNGHRDIGFIWGAPGFQGIGTRFEIYKLALEASGLRVNPDWIRHCGHRLADGYEAARVLLQEKDHPTAIFALNDLLAMGTIRAGIDLGLSVPKDFSVIGVDNIDLSAYFHPSITTVGQPIGDYARALTDLILERINGDKSGHRRIELVATLVVRESTGKAPSVS